jgi:hypothetical protein
MNDPSAYVAAVLELYAGLPDTPLHAGSSDQWMARQFLHEEIPLRLVEAALLLGSLPRFVRPPGMPPLPPIRSLAYFRPVIGELQTNPLPDAYLDYLRLKLQRAPQTFPAKCQKTTFSDGR